MTINASIGGDVWTLANIMVIDLVLAGDNAVVVGMAASRVRADIRNKVIMYGIAGAVVMRILLAGLATELLAITGVTLVGGLILLWVCWNLYRDNQSLRDAHTNVSWSPAIVSGATVSAAMTRIITADISMSLDNVIAVAGAARGDLILLSVGLVISVLAMGFAARVIAAILARHRWIADIGLMIILYVAVEMIYRGTVEVLVARLTS